MGVLNFFKKTKLSNLIDPVQAHATLQKYVIGSQMWNSFLLLKICLGCVLGKLVIRKEMPFVYVCDESLPEHSWEQFKQLFGECQGAGALKLVVPRLLGRRGSGPAHVATGWSPCRCLPFPCRVLLFSPPTFSDIDL